MPFNPNDFAPKESGFNPDAFLPNKTGFNPDNFLPQEAKPFNPEGFLPVTKNDFSAAIPDIVNQLKASLLPQGQAEFTPQQISDTSNLSTPESYVSPETKAADAASLEKMRNLVYKNPLQGMEQLGQVAYAKGMGQQVSPEQDKALQDFTVENFKGIVLYPAAVAVAAQGVGWYIANRTLPGAVESARAAITKGLLSKGVPAEKAAAMADEGMTQAVAKAQAVGAEPGIPEFVGIRKAAQKGFGPKEGTPNVPARATAPDGLGPKSAPAAPIESPLETPQTEIMSSVMSPKTAAGTTLPPEQQAAFMQTQAKVLQNVVGRGDITEAEIPALVFDKAKDGVTLRAIVERKMVQNPGNPDLAVQSAADEYHGFLVGIKKTAEAQAKAELAPEPLLKNRPGFINADVPPTPPETVVPHETPITSLDSLKHSVKTMPKVEGANVGPTMAEELKQAATSTKNRATKALEGIKSVSKGIWDSYSKPAPWTDFKDALGDYQGTRQITGFKAAEFAKEIQKTIPSEAQEGITNWIEAQGDRQVLQERLNATADPKLEAGYKAALNLSPEQQALAESVKDYFNSRLKEAQDLGVLDQGVENYVHHIWDRENSFTQEVTKEVNTGLLKKNPGLAKKRIWETFFQGEQLGGTPKDKRIGFLVTAYEQSLNEAIAARNFANKLRTGTGSDGRPLAIPSNAKDEFGNSLAPRDYQVVNHPAFKSGMNQIYVHPEIHTHISNVLGRSAVKDFKVAGIPVGDLALNGSRELKNTLLSLSMFHQVQEGVHAVGHEVNPLSVPEINLDIPLQTELVKHGLMIHGSSGLGEFSEGTSSSGLINRAPVLGKYLAKYGEYLFQNFIPRLKMEMAVNAYARNVKRYAGKYTDDQILSITAEQSNAAFGELNYMMLGRSKTLQDIFRLVVLAPDFLEARTRFAGQALRPDGKEQMAALIRLSLIMAAVAQSVNYMVNGKTDWKNPFSATINGKRYALRSVPGDILHLIDKPRNFFYNRLNPTITRPIVEWLTGRDQFGRKRDFPTQATDWFKAQAPIPVQGPLWRSGLTLVDSILQSGGISSYIARTPAEETALQISLDRIPANNQTPESREKSKLRGDLRAKFLAEGPSALSQAYKEGVIGPKDMAKIEKTSHKGNFTRQMAGWPLEDVAKVMEEANPAELPELRRIFIKKYPREIRGSSKNRIEELKALRSKVMSHKAD